MHTNCTDLKSIIRIMTHPFPNKIISYFSLVFTGTLTFLQNRIYSANKASATFKSVTFFRKNSCTLCKTCYSYISLNSYQTTNSQFLGPRIISKPYFKRPVKSAKDFPVNMTCNIASHFMLHDADVYWLKNGFEKLKYRKIRNHTDEESVLQSTTIELSASSNDSYSHQGYYQCVVFAQRFMKKEVKSSKLQLQFQGNFFVC